MLRYNHENNIGFQPIAFIYLYTLWLFNIAMENGPFIVDFPIKTSIYKGFSMAMLNNQMVYFLNCLQSLYPTNMFINLETPVAATVLLCAPNDLKLVRNSLRKPGRIIGLPHVCWDMGPQICG